MLQNYFKVAIKNLLRFRFVSIINLIGLTTGFAVCGMIYFFVQQELSYDQFHTKADRIYRLTSELKYPGTTPRTLAISAATMAPHLQQKMGEIEGFTRLIPFEKKVIYRQGDKEVVIENAFAADTSFFTLFDFKLLYGDKNTVLKDPANVVISKDLSNKLFGNENPLGKLLTQTFAAAEKDTTVAYIIAGVLDNIPQNSHLQFDAIFNIQSSLPGDWQGQEWHSLIGITYLLARSPISNIPSLEDRIAQSLKGVMASSEYVQLHLQPLSDVHLASTNIDSDDYNYQKFNKQYIYIFSIIAFIVLAIAGVNFTNLSTVIANKRAKEIGIRKTIGADRKSIIIQFLGESVLLTAMAALLGIALIDLLHTPLEHFINRTIDTPIFQDATFLLAMIGLVITLGILAGLYPALYISSFLPVQAIKKLQTSKTPKRLVISSLVVVQFITATALIIGTVVVISQLNYLKNKEKGYEISQVISLNLGAGNWSKYNALKNEWLGVAGVEDVTAARNELGGEAFQTGIFFKNPSGEMQNIAIPVMMTDKNYFTFYKMKFAAGQSFSENALETGNEYIINETLAKQIGWKDPIGQPMKLGWAPETGKIVGVVKDFNFNTLHHKIPPLCIQASTGSNQEVSIKVNTKDLSGTLSALENSWKKQINDRPFDYQFLDEHFATLYESETRISRLITAAALLAVIIACLGLFGIAAFTTEQRTKEIGIRKVLGASVSDVIGLLSKDFMILVIISIIIASPIAWYVMNRWLQDFAYRIDIQWWMFVLAGAAAIGIALLTVSFQAIKAAVANPVESLRSE